MPCSANKAPLAASQLIIFFFFDLQLIICCYSKSALLEIAEQFLSFRNNPVGCKV